MTVAPIDSKLLDVSTYDFSTFDADCLWNAGVRRLIIGTFCRTAPPSEAHDMVTRWRAKGGEIVAFYGLTYFGSDFYLWRDTRWAIELAKEFGVSRVMLDAELDANGITGVTAPTPTPGQRNAELWAVRQAVESAGLKPLIYTYRSWWLNQHANSSAFRDLPLVYANYGVTGVNQPIHELGSLAFGGWTKATLHQYTSTVRLCGRVRDHNYLFAPLDEEDADMAMTDDEFAERMQRVGKDPRRKWFDDVGPIDSRLRHVLPNRQRLEEFANSGKPDDIDRAIAVLKREGILASD